MIRGILTDENHPVWSLKEPYININSPRGDQTPSSWMQKSSCWCSQMLIDKLGIKKIQEYLKKLSYGNQDFSGDTDNQTKIHILRNLWLPNSLEISGAEQVAFLENLIMDELSVSKHAHNMTKNILLIEEIKSGWKLYGKKGIGILLTSDRTYRPIKHGWFIGWIEKGDRRIIFSSHRADDKPYKIWPSIRIEKDARQRLIKIIDQIESKK